MSSFSGVEKFLLKNEKHKCVKYIVYKTLCGEIALLILSCFVKVIMDKNHNIGREGIMKHFPSESQFSQTFFPFRNVFCVQKYNLKILPLSSTRKWWIGS